jgi:hypothetical protein
MLDNTDRRQKNVNWCIYSHRANHQEGAQLAVLMDIRDELQAINAKLDCYRVPRALDALISMGVAARRRKRKR